MDMNPTSFKPSFYKILSNFTQHLGLPRHFTETHREILPENAKLRIASGTTWDVAVERFDDDRYFFTEGWTEFSLNMKLQIYEVLVFAYAGNATFDVTVYGTNNYEKKSNFGDVESESEPSDTDEDLDVEEIDYSSNPRCEIAMKPLFTKLNLPKKFVVEACLAGKKKVRLVYSGGRSMSVKMNTILSGRGYEFHILSSGWGDFRRANGLIDGETYSFEFLKNRKVIEITPKFQSN